MRLLNQSAWNLCERLVSKSHPMRVAVSHCKSGARLIDCGIDARGGLEAGRLLAEICLAGLGRVDFVPARPDVWSGAALCVRTDDPRGACMASQYAGWELKTDSYFAMGSGPMRASATVEPLFEHLKIRSHEKIAVGVLESSQLPPAEICEMIAEKCSIGAKDLTLLIAPTASQCGTIQIVARSVETALHKLHELGFDLNRVESGQGFAPLPPVAGDDLTGIGRTNDAILYGGEVTLWVRGDDESLQEIGPKVPSSASSDHGRPFKEIFKQYDGDFYKIDPHLFSPAVVTLMNVDSGRSFQFGHVLPRVIHESFGLKT